ncbi:hypothetical protein DKX38_011766 [Salix brachista]|uniref:Uncharacterized protein n=1 Tax=Salix brachista TaxID=2182728 RepID=A0A5N5LZW6_9ROSI|nr:hypothetical protein DKX38_011766 [Salix brachista]
MVRIGGILVCMLVVAMDVARFSWHPSRDCTKQGTEPSEDAFKLGLAAAGILGLPHVIANFLGGCVCICSQEDLQRASPHRQLSVACFLFSWIILAAGLSMLGIGTLSNNKSRTSCGFTPSFLLFWRYSVLCSWAVRFVLRITSLPLLLSVKKYMEVMLWPFCFSGSNPFFLFMAQGFS